jgi:hypothetical protein
MAHILLGTAVADALLSTALCVLHHPTQVTQGDPRRRDSSPTDPWVAQHLREATPYGQAPKYLICDNDSKFGQCFARVATTSTIEILKTPFMHHEPMRYVFLVGGPFSRARKKFPYFLHG